MISTISPVNWICRTNTHLLRVMRGRRFYKRGHRWSKSAHSKLRWIISFKMRSLGNKLPSGRLENTKTRTRRSSRSSKFTSVWAMKSILLIRYWTCTRSIWSRRSQLRQATHLHRHLVPPLLHRLRKLSSRWSRFQFLNLRHRPPSRHYNRKKMMKNSVGTPLLWKSKAWLTMGSFVQTRLNSARRSTSRKIRNLPAFIRRTYEQPTATISSTLCRGTFAAKTKSDWFI